MPQKCCSGMHKRPCVAALSSVVLRACASYRHCPEPPAELVARAPKLLSQTGLYTSRRSSHELQPGVTPYTPQFELWSDGASKRRFIWLPAGAQIDTRDPDAWQFPTGTKLIEPGKPRSSVLYKRAHGSLFRPRIQPLAIEQLDPELLPLLDRWITALPTYED